MEAVKSRNRFVPLIRLRSPRLSPMPYAMTTSGACTMLMMDIFD
jgi:hypothetical protein